MHENPFGLPTKLSRAACATALLVSFAVLPPSAARAQGELAMRWSLCAPDGGQTQQPACEFNIGERRLVMTFVPGVAVTDVVGWTLVVDLVSDVTPLPPWWQVQPGGCRPGQMVAGMPSGFEGDCIAPWAANGSAVAQSFLYPRPGGDANQLRVVLGVGVPADQPFSLEAGQKYLAGILVLLFGSTTGEQCPGCSSPVCLVFNSTEIQRLPGAPGPGPGRFETPAPGLGNFCTWGGGTSCTQVPARSRTWGQIKSLYR